MNPSEWTTQYQLTTKVFQFENSPDRYMVCIGAIQENDSEYLRFFQYEDGLALKDLLNRAHYLGALDVLRDRIRVADLIEIVGRRDQYVRLRREKEKGKPA